MLRSDPLLRRAAAAVAAAAVTLALTGCGGDDDTAVAAAPPGSNPVPASPTPPGTGPAGDIGVDVDLSDVTLRIGVQNRNTIEEWAAAGASDGAPYEIEWSFFANAEEQQIALGAHAIDVALDLGTVSLSISQSNNPDQWVPGDTPFANIAVASPVDAAAYPRFFLIGRSELGIESPAELAGHSISYKPGGTTEVFVDLALDSAGLTTEDITPVVLDTADAVAALRSGAIDVWAGGAAAGQALLDDGTGTLIVDNADLDYPGSVSTAVRTSDLDDPVLDAAYRDLVERIATWRDWVATHPEEDARIFVEVLEQKPESADYAARANAYHLIEIDDTFLDYEQYVADTLVKFGVLPDAIDVRLQYDARYNDAAVGSR